jgi:hypothetical protein
MGKRRSTFRRVSRCVETSTRPRPRRSAGVRAIAEAETVSANAARLGRSVHLCLCKTPGQDRLAALLLLVRSSDEISHDDR